MSNKTPFELRTDILQMAKDYMDAQYHLSLDFARRAFDVALDQKQVELKDWEKYFPKMYSIEELNKKAQEMYSFITTK